MKNSGCHCDELNGVIPGYKYKLFTDLKCGTEPLRFIIHNVNSLYNVSCTYHGVLQLDVRVRYLTPTLYKVRSTGKLLARECPPSTPIRLQTRPCA